jgi:hypothetical protein
MNAPLNAMTFQPVATSQLPLFPAKLELAPEGWRFHVEKAAQGNIALVEGRAICSDCGGMIPDDPDAHTVQHAFTCPTMHARRMLSEEPVLRARFTASPPHWTTLVSPLPVYTVDIDAIHGRLAAATDDRTGTKG